MNRVPNAWDFLGHLRFGHRVNSSSSGGIYLCIMSVSFDLPIIFSILTTLLMDCPHLSQDRRLVRWAARHASSPGAVVDSFQASLDQ